MLHVMPGFWVLSLSPFFSNMPGVGDPVPDFNLKDHTGSEVSLKTLKESGKRTLIWFYPKADTPG